MEHIIREAVAKALSEAGVPEVMFVVERPADIAHGDYATNVALVAGKTLGKNSRNLAEELATSIKDTLGTKASKVETAGPGFINITISPEEVVNVLTEAVAQGAEWGMGHAQDGKRICVEYSNPNPFKEVHIGHLMSNVVGEAVSRLIGASGAEVIRDTFGGDVGPHVAKALWQLQKDGITTIESAKQIGEAYARGAIEYEEDETAKKEIDSLNTEIYRIVANQSKNPKLYSLWKEGREVSMKEFRRLFALLGTKLDYEFFDSDTTTPGMRLIEDGLEKGVFEKSEGAIIYCGEDEGLNTLVFVTSRGTPTYETKDLGLAFLKEERIGADENVIITAVEQVGHFQVVFAALMKIAPVLAQKTTHLAHGLLRLSSGKMSSRKGNIITARALIEDMMARVAEKNPDPIVAEQVAIGAIKYMILRQSLGQDIVFDPEKSLSLTGDSGPYVQYALVRAKKILAYAQEGTGGTDIPPGPYDVERLILHFPHVVARAAQERSPNLLTTYLTELASTWNAFYANDQILGSAEEAYKQRTALAFATTMQNGLTLLGIPTPEKM